VRRKDCQQKLFDIIFQLNNMLVFQVVIAMLEKELSGIS